MSDTPLSLTWADWSKAPETWNGTVEGHRLGTDVSVMFYTTDEVGAGPGLHTHPYDEIFVIREGRALFTVGEEEITAQKGDVLRAPAGVWHRFHNLGPGRLETTDLHLAPDITVTWPDKGDAT